MNISPFKVEEWMNAYETQATNQHRGDVRQLRVA